MGCRRSFTLVSLVVALNLASSNVIIPRKLLLISMDGLRWDFTNDVVTPNFDWMADHGAKAAYVTPAMLTLTAVCHTTIATGLYPESHGVVHNQLFNQTTGEKLGFYETCNESRWYDAGGEPIWTTASKQGMKTGVYRWPGGTVSTKGVLPDYAVLNTNFNGTTAWRERVDTLMTWFTEEDIDVGLLYFNEPDYVLHSFGTESKQRKEKVSQCDGALGYLFQRIRELRLTDTLNVIVTSDHGHLNYIKVEDLSNPIELFKYVNETDFEFHLADYGPVALLTPKKSKMDEIYNTLRNAHPNMTVYKKEEFPDFWHYAKNDRVPPIIALSDPGYQIFTRFPGYYNLNFSSDHGYDNRLMSMKASFYAVGPDIKKGSKIDEMLAVDIYPLMAKLLSISPAPNNGSLSRVSHILKSSPPISEGVVIKGRACVMVMCTISVFFSFHRQL